MLNVRLETEEMEKLKRNGYSILERTVDSEQRINVYNYDGKCVVELVYNAISNDILVMDEKRVRCFDFVEIFNSCEKVGINGSSFEKPYQTEILDF